MVLGVLHLCVFIGKSQCEDTEGSSCCKNLRGCSSDANAEEDVVVHGKEASFWLGTRMCPNSRLSLHVELRNGAINAPASDSKGKTRKSRRSRCCRDGNQLGDKKMDCKLWADNGVTQKTVYQASFARTVETRSGCELNDL